MKTILILFVLAFFSVQLSFAEPRKLVVVLDWYVNPNHAPLLIAEQQHFFDQAGLKVELIAPSDPADPPKWVATHKADIAIDYQPHFFLEKKYGLPLQQIGTLIPTPLNCLIMRSDHNLQTIEDLKGKKIGYSTNGIDDVILSAMLKQHGITLKEVQLINLHYNLLQALLTNKVDAVIGTMRNVELVQLQRMKTSIKVFYPENEGFPSYSELIFVARKDMDDATKQHFLNAVERGRQFLLLHPDQSWQIVKNKFPELDNEINRLSWFKTIPYFKIQLISE